MLHPCVFCGLVHGRTLVAFLPKAISQERVGHPGSRVSAGGELAQGDGAVVTVRLRDGEGLAAGVGHRVDLAAYRVVADMAHLVTEDVKRLLGSAVPAADLRPALQCCGD